MEPPRREFLVNQGEAGLRLDRHLAAKLPRLSRARIQSLTRAGFVRLNGQQTRSSALVRAGDRIELREPAPQKVSLVPEQMPLKILFEDHDIIVINKAAGTSVHPGAGRLSGTLVNALLGHCRDLSGIGGEERPGIVHRLDRETSGCLVVAKNDAAHLSLAKQFAIRKVEKIYLALVAGKLRQSSGTIDAAIARHRVHRKRMSVSGARGRSARTDFQVLRSSRVATLVQCRLHTGRAHQIRVHLQHLGHPILGDKVYGGRRAGKFDRQMLHAWKLGFDHPRSGERMQFEAPLPSDFKQAMREGLG